MTRRSRRSLHFLCLFCNSFIDDGLGEYLKVKLVNDAPVDFDFLYPLATGLVRCEYFDLSDIFVHDGLRQLSHINISVDHFQKLPCT